MAKSSFSRKIYKKTPGILNHRGLDMKNDYVDLLDYFILS